MIDVPATGDADAIAHLQRRIAKLEKINSVLIDRVERSTDAQGSAFGLFQAAITLEKTVQLRTDELQKLNAQLERAKEAAERSNLGKTRFLAAAGHDLLQPLHIARLFLETLGERERDEESQRLLARVGASLDAAGSLISTLLEISRLDAGGQQPVFADVPVATLLDAIREDYVPAAEDRELRLRVVPSDAVVHTDPALLDRLLRNFVSNALRYTRRGGIVVGCRRRRGWVRFEVWDTGLGIPPERLTEIFEEFRQLETPGREREGMGLGLAIVERIARLLDVRLDVRSREGRGSMFAVDVPAGDPAARLAPPARVSMRERPNPLAGRTVLVIDDDRDTLDGMAMILDGWGCRTLMARSIETAVALTARRAARPDFIFADYHLGAGGTGLEAVERIRACYDASIGAAIVTADRSTETEARVTANGMPLLNKPVTVERLRSVIHKALG